MFTNLVVKRPLATALTYNAKRTQRQLATCGYSVMAQPIGRVLCLRSGSVSGCIGTICNFSSSSGSSSSDDRDNSSNQTSSNNNSDSNSGRHNVNKHVPDEFYDEDEENDKEFLDTIAALKEGGLHKLTTPDREGVKWDEIIKEGLESRPDFEAMSAEPNAASFHDEIDKMNENSPSPLMAKLESNFVHEELGEHLGDFENTQMIPDEYLDFTQSWKKRDQSYSDKEREVHRLMDKFIPNTAPEKYDHDTQGHRHCPGHLQRRGKAGSIQSQLRCHKIDLEELSPVNVVHLRRFVSLDCEILSKKQTGLCTKCQRKVAKTIKQARCMGLFPHIGEFILRDTNPTQTSPHFHLKVGSGKGQAQAQPFVSKTIRR